MGTRFKGTPIMENLLKEVREYGIGCVLIDQMPSSLTKTTIANTNAQFTFQLKQQSDINAAGSYSLLSEKDKEVFGLTPVGTAVVRVQSRSKRPFLVKIPRVLVKKGIVSDEQVKMHMQKLKGNHSPSNSKKSKPIPLSVNKIMNRENNLSTNEYSLLESIFEHPLWITSKRYKGLGMGVKKGTLLIQRLINENFIEAVTFSTSYARIVLYSLTDKAKVLLLDKGKNIRQFPHSLPHEFGVNLIVQFYEKQGLAVHREVQCENGYIDLVVFNGDRKLLVEFETGKSDIAKNIRKCLAFDDQSKIIIVGMNSAVKKKIEKIIEDKKLHSERLEIKLLGAFK